MIISRISPFSGKEHTMEINITKEQYDAWLMGTNIQTAMFNISPEEREFIMTGITPKEWNDTFGSSEEN